jgi:WD40 repeat protein
LIKTETELHTAGIRFLKYLSNGNVASCSDDKTVNIWETTSGASSSIRVYRGHTDRVFVVDEIDSDTMVSGSRDETVQIWSISTGATMYNISVGHRIWSVKALILNGSSFIACGLSGSRENLQIYTKNGVLAKTLIGHGGDVFTIEILNERFMATGSDDYKVIVWDLNNYMPIYNLTEHRTNITCLKLISSSLMASASRDGLIIIWNWLTGRSVHALIGHTEILYLSSLDMFDEKTLISGSRDKTVKFWDISTGLQIKSVDVDIQVNALAMVKTSKFIINVLLTIDLFKATFFKTLKNLKVSIIYWE